MKFYYRVRTLKGLNEIVEAESAAEACRILGVLPHELKKYYPFPISVVKTSEEQEAQKQRLATLNEKNRLERQEIRSVTKRRKRVYE